MPCFTMMRRNSKKYVRFVSYRRCFRSRAHQVPEAFHEGLKLGGRWNDLIGTVDCHVGPSDPGMSEEQASQDPWFTDSEFVTLLE